jgi:hypothetical protein
MKLRQSGMRVQNFDSMFRFPDNLFAEGNVPGEEIL